jgi:hypothetical protein
MVRIIARRWTQTLNGLLIPMFECTQESMHHILQLHLTTLTRSDRAATSS